MAVAAQVVTCEALTVATAKVLEYEHDLSVVGRGCVEVVHGLIPDGQLGAGDVVPGSPTMRLALNKDFLSGTAQVKST